MDIASERATLLRSDVGRSLRMARQDHDLSLDEVAKATAISASQVGRIERGIAPSVTIEQVARVGAAVGLEVSLRLFPRGDPIRDAAHDALLGRLERLLHPSLRLLREVPLPIPGDLRAWDAVIRGQTWSMPAEAETRPRDLQALERRLMLKLRDGGFDKLLLILLDSAHNRRLVRAHSESLAALFAIPPNRALDRLGAGVEPEGSALLLI